MAHISQLAAGVNIAPKPSEETKITLNATPVPLMQTGFNIPLSISTPSSAKTLNPDIVIRSATIMAHFDTGASKTSIDTGLATYLGLTPVGISPIHTAAGKVDMPNFAVDITFPGSKLSPFINLPISSCKLPIQIKSSGEIEISPQNFGLLIGRDMMSRWNIVWNGPTSTVFISD